ncbi:ComEC/Rec2 family competence protein [Aestuariibaculum sp. YM273]|uniref:ComEC/Rec2 family competence protein n=1 Tax=Aestuariibaculum sp. YM273 TaxID=3070659 RepID=UPI0027DD5577|nr:ComEC/Rec2 family competence protein [Aestuariibaculum sp. YM273]WMI64239.1 ComEC/Rec2 family competence protein [Aestuariibaculum sp. YM273]
MKILNFTIIKLTLCLITGIIIGYSYNFSVNLSLYLVIVLLSLLAVSYGISKKQIVKTIWFGLFSYLSMISIGILAVVLHNPCNFNNHYTKKLQLDATSTITFRVQEVLKPNTYYDKYIVNLLELDSNQVSGKTLINIRKDSIGKKLNIDDVYITKTVLHTIPSPLNPGQFNYKAYLKRKYIYHQITLSDTELLKIKSKKNTILGYADAVRNYINTKLGAYHFKPDELAIINALFLGQRQDISNEIYTNYANAGVIHILAVSGLHIGIILIILYIIFKPIEYLKHGKIYKTALLLIILWSFAIIAGLSASVTRAVTMFSVLAIAVNLKRPTNIYNTLALSIFILLLFKPMFLFDVGFQLSYLAVLAIVTIDPLLYKLWIPKNKILNFYWHTFTVTIAAQLGVIPISLYYFHQFPGLFFISNLVIIPLLGFILGFGILIIILASLGFLPSFLATSFSYSISLINKFIEWIAKQETFIFKDLPFNLSQVLASYTLIITLVFLLKKRTLNSFKLVLSGIIALQIAFIYTSYQKPNREFIIFQKSRHSLISNTYNHKTTFSTDVDSIPLFRNSIVDYKVSKQINTSRRDSIASIYLLNKKRLLVVDSLGVYNLKSFHPDFLLLRQSPKINLNRLIDSIKPKAIISDGSNYKSYVHHWKTIALKRKLPFHYTGEKGAFIIRY